MAASSLSCSGVSYAISSTRNIPLQVSLLNFRICKRHFRDHFFLKFFFLSFFLLLIVLTFTYFGETERDSVSRGGAEREGDTESEAGSRL